MVKIIKVILSEKTFVLKLLEIVIPVPIAYFKVVAI